MASKAKPSTLACESGAYGSPRRCATRDDRLMQALPKENVGGVKKRLGATWYRTSPLATQTLIAGAAPPDRFAMNI